MDFDILPGLRRFSGEGLRRRTCLAAKPSLLEGRRDFRAHALQSGSVSTLQHHSIVDMQAVSATNGTQLLHAFLFSFLSPLFWLACLLAALLITSIWQTQKLK